MPEAPGCPPPRARAPLVGRAGDAGRRALRAATLSALALAVAGGCRPPDARARSATAERDALRRDVVGLRKLSGILGAANSNGGLGKDDAIVVVRDSLVRALLDAALPTTVRLRDRAEVRLERANAEFEANVTRVALRGTVRQLGWPNAEATLTLGGALTDFAVDSTGTLRARLAIDQVLVAQPMGVPVPLRAPAQALLQQLVDRGLPEVTAALPSVAIPVRLDQAISLPGFGPDGPISVAPVEARIAIQVSRVATWGGYTWIVLHTERGKFAPPVRPAVASTVSGDTSRPAPRAAR